MSTVVGITLNALYIQLTVFILKNSTPAYTEIAIMLSFFEMIATLAWLDRYERVSRFVKGVCRTIRILIPLYILVIPVCIVLAFTKI